MHDTFIRSLNENDSTTPLHVDIWEEMSSYVVSHPHKFQAPEHLPGDEPKYTHRDRLSAMKTSGDRSILCFVKKIHCTGFKISVKCKFDGETLTKCDFLEGRLPKYFFQEICSSGAKQLF